MYTGDQNRLAMQSTLPWATPWVFFILHFGLGAFLLTVTKLNIEYDINFAKLHAFWVTPFLGTAWLLSGVLWGNFGWDAWKMLRENPTSVALPLAVNVMARMLFLLCLVTLVFTWIVGRKVNFDLYLLGVVVFIIIIIEAYKILKQKNDRFKQYFE